mmetsp:Transcript_90421/g.193866  ORF Transcript_90421/g.193866 Transcript_90421/m.193866 type:complete len:459 (+) Transcript_90421:75-1451(+)
MTADLLDAQKRKLEDSGDGTSCEAAKRAAAGATPTPMEVDGGLLMKNEDFSLQLLRIYYDRLFPFLKMFRWLSYKNDPKSSSSAVQKDFFLRREFTFVLEGDIFCRYQCFRDAEEFKSRVMSQQPVRMEIGAIFTHPPKNHNMVIKDAYKPLERELVFDIDMDDYDEIRTCCTGAKLCTKCWTFMKAAIKTLQRALRDDFGFKHMLFVYSGRRGVHCWVCDKAARRLNNEQRSAVAEYLSLVTGGAGKTRAKIANNCDELHPSVVEAHKICEQYFVGPGGVLEGQDIMKKGPHLSKIMETMSEDDRKAISKYMLDNPQATSLQIWQELEKCEAERRKAGGSFRQRQEAKIGLKDIVIQYTYPRLDVNVSKQMNHLLKSPFVVHPKTGRVCVPIDPEKVEAFDPLKVPTVGRLVEELNRTGDANQTSLKDYTHFFDVNFLQPLERESAQEMGLTGAMDF